MPVNSSYAVKHLLMIRNDFLFVNIVEVHNGTISQSNLLQNWHITNPISYLPIGISFRWLIVTIPILSKLCSVTENGHKHCINCSMR